MPSTYTDRLNGLTTSVAVKAPVRAATTAAITLAGTQTIDGVALASGDRVLVKNQSSAIDNGIYQVNSGTWTRTPDFDGSLDVVGGTLLKVNQGSAYANSYWEISGNGPLFPGTDAITIIATSGYITFAAELAGSGGGGMVGSTATDDGAKLLTWAQIFDAEPVNLLSFIDATDHAAFRHCTLGNIDAALLKFHDALKTRALAGSTPEGYIPSGKIVTSLDLNWAIRGLILRAGGEVEWKYTGVASGFRMDGTATDAVLPRLLDADGVTPVGVYNCTVHPGIVVRADTGTGVYIRKMHHCDIAVRCKSALDVAFKHSSNVNSAFRRMSISYNQQPLVVVPPIGMLVTGSAGDQNSYCTYYDCIEEGPATGIKCDYALGNMFFGGGAEGCATVGLQTTINSQSNRFYGQDYEQNNPAGTKVDVLMDGIGNEFFGSETQNLFKFTGNAYACRLVGGVHNAITFDVLTADNVIDGASYNRQATGATITDNSNPKLNRTCNITDRGNERTYNAIPTALVIDLTAETSPYLYENQTRMDQIVSISGATNCGRLRPLGGGPVSGADQGTAGEFILQPGDKANAYWSGTPATFVVFSI